MYLNLENEILEIVAIAPDTLSPIAIEFLLRGEPFARNAEKISEYTDLASYYGRYEIPVPYYGSCYDENLVKKRNSFLIACDETIKKLIAKKIIRKSSGFYPALKLVSEKKQAN